MSTTTSHAGASGRGRRRQELRLQRPHMNREQRVSLSCEPPSPPGPGEILVRVQAHGVNQADHALCTGAEPQPGVHGAPFMYGIGAAGTVIAAGDHVTRFAVGDEVFGHFVAESWAWVQGPCARTTADGPHIEHRPEGLDPLAAAALVEAGLTAKTIVRAAEVRPGQTTLVIGATCGAGTVLVPLLADAGAHVIAGAIPDDDDYVRSLGAADTIEHTTADRVTDALTSLPDVDLFVDLVNFGEPYLITATANTGTILTGLPVADQPGIPRIPISAEPGDLAALAQHALDGRLPGELTYVYRLETVGQAAPAKRRPAAQPALALGGQDALPELSTGGWRRLPDGRPSMSTPSRSGGPGRDG